jgi:hypothetical protein
MNFSGPTKQKYKSRFKIKSPLSPSPKITSSTSKPKNPWRKRILLSKTKKSSFLDRLESGLAQKKTLSTKNHNWIPKKTMKLTQLISFMEDYKEIKLLFNENCNLFNKNIYLEFQNKEG